ncbi:MAG: hypothetical protein R3F56_25720 [Planctomycetota bacterium]
MSERTFESPAAAGSVLRADAIRHVPHAAWLTDGGATPAGAMTVVPIVADGRVAGIEVRCRCGESVLIECVYEDEPS